MGSGGLRGFVWGAAGAAAFRWEEARQNPPKIAAGRWEVGLDGLPKTEMPWLGGPNAISDAVGGLQRGPNSPMSSSPV